MLFIVDRRTLICRAYLVRASVCATVLCSALVGCAVNSGDPTGSPVVNEMRQLRPEAFRFEDPLLPPSPPPPAPAATPSTGTPPDLAPPRRPPAAPVMIRGTGNLVNNVPPPRAGAEATPEGDVTMNFVRAEIQDVARAVLGEMLKLNYAVDPRVQGQITVQTTTPLRREAVLPTLEALLRLNGATIVNGNGFYRVVPLADAQRVAATANNSNDPTFGTHVVPLRHISAQQMQKVLEPLAPEGAIRYVDPVRNVIVLAGTQQEVAAMLGTVDAFDTDWLAAMSIGLYPLRSADPKAVANELSVIFGDAGKENAATATRFLPVERLNSVLAITPRPEYLERVREWTERLDRGSDDGAPQLFVYFVRNGPAADLAAVLSNAFGGGGDLTPSRSRRGGGGVAPTLGAVELRTSTNTSAFVSPATGQVGQPFGRVSAVEQQLWQQRNAATAGGAIAGAAAGAAAGQAVGQRFAQAGGGTAGATPFPAGIGDSGGAATGDGIDVGSTNQVRFIPDESKNAILIFATPRQYRTIESAIRRLDIMPLQVAIEATIAEVTLNDQLQYGIQYFFQRGNHTVALSNTAGAVSNAISPGFSYVLSAGTSTQVVLNLLASLSNVRVVSSPQVMVMDNQTARLQVGDQVPIPVQQAVSTLTAGAPIVNSIEFRDTGVILEVTPHVNPGGPVILDIKQEVSDVAATTSSAIVAPTIQQRRIASTVAVENEQSIALGGLIRNSKTDTRSGIPFLMDLPLLGPLFRTTTDDKSRTELIILLTPKVIRDSADAFRATQDLKRRLHAVAPPLAPETNLLPPSPAGYVPPPPPPLVISPPSGSTAPPTEIAPVPPAGAPGVRPTR